MWARFIADYKISSCELGNGVSKHTSRTNYWMLTLHLVLLFVIFVVDAAVFKVDDVV